ncbi:sensor histidine kinase [Alloiococcus sp. CFN-8]|uniref:sensor histidine kinase n=1 Tax=Alloiococcus sp. CFN-8 TaxID=3416081 RepID=UPI003CEDCDD7
MKKSKGIFIIVLTLLLITTTSIVMSFYDNVKGGISKDNGLLQNYLEEDLPIYTLAAAKELDPDYQILTFEAEVPADVKENMSKYVNDFVASVKYYLETDDNFVSSIRSTKNENVISNNLDKINNEDDKSRYTLYSSLKYDENGYLTAEGDLYSGNYSQYEAIDILGRVMDYQRTADGKITYYINGTTIDGNQVKINNPKAMEITYIIPEELITEGAIYHNSYSWNYYHEFTLIALLISSGILGLFMLFYPIRVVEEIKPYLLIKKWKAGINIAVLATAITLAAMGTYVVCVGTLDGSLLDVLKEYNTGNYPLIINIINFIAWLSTLLIISLGLFQIKYIFARGFFRYLREDTLIGSFCRFIKKNLDQIAEADLAGNISRELLKFTVINGFIVALMIAAWFLGYIPFIIYIFGSFIYLRKKVIKIQMDYKKLLEATRELSRGNFNDNINEDVGVFNSLKDEFKDIKASFEKAVKEETKSQNMKTELISNVSHDLKTPLTCIKNYIVLLQDDTISEEERHEYLDNLNKYSDRLTTLIEDLFEVSRVNSGDIQLELMDLNIVALIEQALAETSELITYNNLSVIRSFENNEIMVNLDGGKTYRIFENLFTNIGKYSMPGSRVYINVKEVSDEVIIEFKNISQNEMNFTPEEIIERFVRGDKSRHEKGSGLGLAIVKSFTEIQGGSFQINIDGDLFKTIITFKKSKDQAQ